MTLIEITNEAKKQTLDEITSKENYIGRNDYVNFNPKNIEGVHSIEAEYTAYGTFFDVFDDNQIDEYENIYCDRISMYDESGKEICSINDIDLMN